MFALLYFALAVLVSPFKSRSRLEAENAALRHQLMVLRRKVPGRVRLTNSDRWLYAGSDRAEEAAGRRHKRTARNRRNKEVSVRRRS